MIVDTEGDARRASKRTRLLRGAGKSRFACVLGVSTCNAFFSMRYAQPSEALNGLTTNKGKEWVEAVAVIDSIICRSELIHIEGDKSMRKRIS